MKSRARFLHLLKMFPFLTKTSCLPFNATWNFKINKMLWLQLKAAQGFGRCLFELQKPPVAILYPFPHSPKQCLEQRALLWGRSREAGVRQEKGFLSAPALSV